MILIGEQPQTRGDVITDPHFRPSPEDIPADREHLWGAFGNHETEVSAHWLVKFARERGSWQPFTRRDIEGFYRASGMRDGFTFNRLIEPGTGYGRPGERYRAGGGWIVERDRLLHFTTEFVLRCHMSATNDPKLREVFPDEQGRL